MFLLLVRSVAAFHTNKDLSYGSSCYTKVIDKQLNNRNIPVFSLLTIKMSVFGFICFSQSVHRNKDIFYELTEAFCFIITGPSGH